MDLHLAGKSLMVLNLEMAYEIDRDIYIFYREVSQMRLLFFFIVCVTRSKSTVDRKGGNKSTFEMSCLKELVWFILVRLGKILPS